MLFRSKSLVGITDIIPILMGAVSNQLKPIEEKTKFLNLVLSVVSLCVFPFAAQPLISKILPGSVKFEDFIEQRRSYVKKIATHLIEEL